MAISNIKTSGFSLAKRKELTGDDFYDVKTIGNLLAHLSSKYQNIDEQ